MGTVNVLTKKGREQSSRITEYDWYPHFVYEAYISDYLVIRTMRLCPNQ